MMSEEFQAHYDLERIRETDCLKAIRVQIEIIFCPAVKQ